MPDRPNDAGEETGTTARDWMPDVYEMLRSLAGRSLRRERSSPTLQPTLLVHETYLRLTTGDGDVRFPDRDRFLAAAARALREVLVDHARRRDARKRGGSWSRVTLAQADLAQNGSKHRAAGIDLLDLEEALNDLRVDHPRAAQVVELRIFGGLTIEEMASAVGISARSVNLDWRFARAWLDERLRPAPDGSGKPA